MNGMKRLSCGMEETWIPDELPDLSATQKHGKKKQWLTGYFLLLEKNSSAHENKDWC